MKKIALIDGDVYAYRAAASCEPRKHEREMGEGPLAEWIALGRCRESLERTFLDVSPDSYHLYLSGGGNFRKRIDPSYKANRRDMIRPTWLESVRLMLAEEFGARVTDGYEADDAIGIAHTPDKIVCSIDKDMFQLSGEHYNFVKQEFRTISPQEAEKFIYKLMLIGDRSDNITGVSGIGEIKSSRIVDSYDDINELHEYVRSLYNDDQRFTTNLRLFRILRSEKEYENILSEIQRQEPTENGSDSDFSPFSTINS